MTPECGSRLWLELPGEEVGAWYYCEKVENHDPNQSHSTADGYAWFETLSTQRTNFLIEMIDMIKEANSTPTIRE